MSNNEFAKLFEGVNNTNGFYEFTPYINGIGFGVKKNLNSADINHTSLLKFFVPENNKVKEKIPINIGANYGRKTKDGVYLRNDTDGFKFFSPVDLINKDDYYYDKKNNKLFEGKKEISPIDLINKIYNNHIKPTKTIRGLWLRAKMFFWRTMVNKFFSYLATIFHYLLYLLTGDWYSYEPVLKEEVLNNKIIDHRWKEMIGKQKSPPKMKGILKESKRFIFFGYETSYWAIRIYSIIILAFYIVFLYKKWRPIIVVKIFNNSLLIVCFIILSLWLIEGIVPLIIKKIIKSSSMVAANSLYRRIKI